MSRRLATTVAFAAAAAFALAFANPAKACDCSQHKETAAAQKKADKAAPKAGSKAEVKAPPAKDKKADASVPASNVLAAVCNCDKDGKNCTCPKGECKCPNCQEHKPKARAS